MLLLLWINGKLVANLCIRIGFGFRELTDKILSTHLFNCFQKFIAFHLEWDKRCNKMSVQHQFWFYRNAERSMCTVKWSWKNAKNISTGNTDCPALRGAWTIKAFSGALFAEHSKQIIEWTSFPAFQSNDHSIILTTYVHSTFWSSALGYSLLHLDTRVVGTDLQSEENDKLIMALLIDSNSKLKLIPLARLTMEFSSAISIKRMANTINVSWKTSAKMECVEIATALPFPFKYYIINKTNRNVRARPQ